MPGISIQQLGHVEFKVKSTFGSGHQALLFRRLDDPLAVLAVAGEVHFDGLGIVVLRVLLEDVAGLLQAFKPVCPITYPWASRINARPQDLTTFYHVAIGEYVGRGGLRVAGSGYAVSQVGIVHPGLAFVQTPVGPHVGVGVYKAGYDGFTRHVHDLCPCGSLD